MEWLSQTLTSKICPSTSGFEAVKTITTKCTRFWSCGGWQSGYSSMRTQQRPVPVSQRQNTENSESRDVGHRRWTKRSCPATWRVSQKVAVWNANLWAFVLNNYSASENRSFICQVQDGHTQTWQNYEDPGIDHSTRKAVVAKLKKAGQPRQKIIQITFHANETSLDDHDEIDEDGRRTLSHIISDYSGHLQWQVFQKRRRQSQIHCQFHLQRILLCHRANMQVRLHQLRQVLPSAKQASAYSLAHHYSNLQTTQQISNSTTTL